jgi:predicted acetyltransferase
MALTLVAPNERYRETVLRGLRELRDEGLPWHVAVDFAAIERDFAAFVASKLADVHRSDVPATHLWAIEDEHFVRRISIRHALNDALRIEGGHIGYDTVPTFRGRGVATEMLRQALRLARELGLTSVLVTCDDTNARSIRVIERNGGTLIETKAIAPNRPLKRYSVIDLTRLEPPSSYRSTTSP